MNNLEYLNEISKSNRPSKRTKSAGGFGTILKVLIGGIVAFVIILIAGLIVNNSSSPKNATRALYLRTSSLNITIVQYNNQLKSSKLRAIGTSLNGVLVSASNELSRYYANSGLDPTPTEKEYADETAYATELRSTLTNARLNGLLDRVYATQIQLQVSLLLSMISNNLETTRDNNLRAILEQYQSNLSTIEDSFKKYSNPNS